MNVNVNLMVENVTQIKSETTVNIMRVQKSKKTCMQKIYIWNPSTSTCESGKYLASITGD